MNLKMYEDIINLKLFYQMKELISTTSTKSSESWRKTLLGYTKVEETLFSKYELKYPGEVLERHAERGLTTIEDLRAIALALGECYDILEPTMFVADQYTNFINDIKSKSFDDVYLKIALGMLLSGDEQEQVVSSITDYVDGSPEIILLVLSMVSIVDTSWDGFSHSVASMFESHSVNVYDNMKAVKWVFDTYGDKIVSSKDRSLRVLKNIAKLINSNVTDTKPEFKYLTSLGYSDGEIYYMNMMLSGWRGLEKSTPKVRTILNAVIKTVSYFVKSEDDVNDSVIEDCCDVLKELNVLPVNIEGQNTIKGILANMSIGNAKMYKILYNEYKLLSHNNWFIVNILDSKWDSLYKDLGPTSYNNIFKSAIRQFEDDNINDYLSKYKAITGTDYIDRMYCKNDGIYDTYTFKLLVKNGTINLYKRIDAVINNTFDDKVYVKYVSDYFSSNRLDNSIVKYLKYTIDNYGYSAIDTVTNNHNYILDIVGISGGTYLPYDTWKNLQYFEEDNALILFKYCVDLLYIKWPGLLPEAIVLFLDSKYSEYLGANTREELCKFVVNDVDMSRQRGNALIHKCCSEDYYNDVLKRQAEDDKKEEESKHDSMLAEWTAGIEETMSEADTCEDYGNAFIKIFSDYHISRKEYCDLCMKELDNRIDDISFDNDSAGKLLRAVSYCLVRNDITFDEFKNIVERLKVA